MIVPVMLYDAKFRKLWQMNNIEGVYVMGSFPVVPDKARIRVQLSAQKSI
jgi:hypothetical protein